MDKNIMLLAAKTIVENHKKIKTFWNEIDHYKEFGTLPIEQHNVLKRQVEDLTIGQIITACFTLPPYISKGKKKLATLPEGPERMQLALEIKLKELELEEIKALRE